MISTTQTSPTSSFNRTVSSFYRGACELAESAATGTINNVKVSSNQVSSGLPTANGEMRATSVSAMIVPMCPLSGKTIDFTRLAAIGLAKSTLRSKSYVPYLYRSSGRLLDDCKSAHRTGYTERYIPLCSITPNINQTRALSNPPTSQSFSLP